MHIAPKPGTVYLTDDPQKIMTEFMFTAYRIHFKSVRPKLIEVVGGEKII